MHLAQQPERIDVDAVDSQESERAVAHIEVRIKSDERLYHTLYGAGRQQLIEASESLIRDSLSRIKEGDSVKPRLWEARPHLRDVVDSIKVVECSEAEANVSNCDLVIFPYSIPTSDIVDEMIVGDPEADEDDDLRGAVVTELPSASLEGVWETLIYGDDVKERLLRYVYTTMLFSDTNVDFNIITYNRVVLLHGPPGTGKTTLCRALAQKVAIHMNARFTSAQLVEINSHSLFSKWFSESGKLVQRLFGLVTELVERGGFVVILVDEVESLTAARGSGNEPSDALRVVNAVLTQLDKLKQHRNVLVMTTSNISQSIDAAFIDRADIKQYVGLPPARAIYGILKSCIESLQQTGLVSAPSSPSLLSWEAINSSAAVAGYANVPGAQESHLLRLLATNCEGMSGRALRRLPLTAFARHIRPNQGTISVAACLRALEKAVGDYKSESQQATQGGST